MYSTIATLLAVGVDTIATGMTIGALYALVAVGLTMVYGMFRILHIAHAAVLVIGAYAGYYMWHMTGSFWLSLPIAMLVGGIVSVAIYALLYQWIIEEEPLIPLIASIGLYIALTNGYRLLFGTYAKSFSPTFALSGPVLTFTTKQFIIVMLTVILFIGVYLLVNYTRVGLAWQVTAQDRETAGAIGINVQRITAFNFFVAGALAGVAGALIGVYYGSVSPYMGNVWAYKTFAIIVLGGMGSIPGTIIAAFLLGLSETIIIAQWGYIIPRDAIAFALMILVLMFKPEGLLGGDSSVTRSVKDTLRSLRGHSDAEQTEQEVQ